MDLSEVGLGHSHQIRERESSRKTWGIFYFLLKQVQSDFFQQFSKTECYSTGSFKFLLSVAYVFTVTSSLLINYLSYHTNDTGSMTTLAPGAELEWRLTQELL